MPVSGPFRFYRVKPGKGMRLSRNQHYVDHLTGAPAYLDHLRFRWFSDADGLIQTYRKDPGALDVALGLDDSAAGLHQLHGLHDIVTDPSSVYELLAPNWAAGHCSVALQPIRGGACPMHDPAMRTALALAIDRAAIDQRLLGGHGWQTDSALLPGAWFGVPATPSSPDLALAKQTLTAAGWVVDPDTGFRYRDLNGDGHENGHDYDAMVEACTTTRQVREDTLAMVSGFMNQLGVRVLISPVDPSDFFRVMARGYREHAVQPRPRQLRRGPLRPLIVNGHLHALRHLPLQPVRAGWQERLACAQCGPGRGSGGGRREHGRRQGARRDVPVHGGLRRQRRRDTRSTATAMSQLVDPALVNFDGNASTGGPFWNVQHWWLQPWRPAG